MEVIINLIFNGLNLTDLALFLNRLAIGLFFAISGYHKLFVRERHEQLVATLQACGIPFIGFCQWFVPLVEFLGGIAVLIGFMAPFAALGLVAILVVALLTDGPRRIKEFQPINQVDYLDDVLYLSETAYLVMVLIVIFVGPGSYSLHQLILS